MGDGLNFKDTDVKFFQSSPFLNEVQDINNGLDALVFLKKMLKDVYRSSSKDFMAYIHGLLKPVLVENLPIIECLERFDRNYTVSFLPQMSMQSLDPEAFGDFLIGMKGKLLTDYVEDESLLLICCKEIFTIDVTSEGVPSGKNLVCLEPR